MSVLEAGDLVKYYCKIQKKECVGIVLKTLPGPYKNNLFVERHNMCEVQFAPDGGPKDDKLPVQHAGSEMISTYKIPETMLELVDEKR